MGIMAATPQTASATIDDCRRAARILRETPGRLGSVVHLDSERADDVVISADLHGHRINFTRILRTAELRLRPRRHLILQEVCHGGPEYPGDGGCMSHLLLEDVARRVIEFPGRVHFILGNHEFAELTDFPIRKGHQMLNLMFRRGTETFYGPAASSVRSAYLDFLRACPLAVRLANGVLISHSLPEPLSAPIDRKRLEQPLEELDLTPAGPVFRGLWGRDYRPGTAEAFARAVDARVLIHGHEPCDAGFLVPNAMQIILDSSHHAACCLTVRVDEVANHRAMVERIQHLDAPEPSNGSGRPRGG